MVAVVMTSVGFTYQLGGFQQLIKSPTQLGKKKKLEREKYISQCNIRSPQLGQQRVKLNINSATSLKIQVPVLASIPRLVPCFSSRMIPTVSSITSPLNSVHRPCPGVEVLLIAIDYQVYQ